MYSNVFPGPALPGACPKMAKLLADFYMKRGIMKLVPHKEQNDVGK
jgi:hypothetical protein